MRRDKGVLLMAEMRPLIVKLAKVVGGVSGIVREIAETLAWKGIFRVNLDPNDKTDHYYMQIFAPGIMEMVR
jgi:hypothetical protein